MRWRFLALKRIEDAALAALRKSPAGVAAPAARALLFAVHRQALAAIARLPPAPIAATSDGRGGLKLGVHHQRTLVVRYDPAWVGRYAEEEALIRDFLGEFQGEIHHVGSTAVPNLAAKPIIDLAIGLPEVNHEAEVARTLSVLTKLGYLYLGDRRHRGGHYLEKASSCVRTHAVQLHAAGAPDLTRLLRFRDRLRSDDPAARRYADIKASLARAIRDDRRAYVWYKSHWISHLLLEDQGSAAWGKWLLLQTS
jgi:GrpB-like predicted nucleotidyltransferase (UPF0157 family)